MTSEAPQMKRELHSRVNDGIHVRLLWSESDGEVSVSVSDAKTGAAFSLVVDQGERALDVFHHPFAFAAWHGIDTGSAPRQQSDASLAASH